MSLEAYTKAPNATLDYSINWATEDTYLNDGSALDTGWLKGDTIATSTWTVPAGLTAGADTNNTTTATITLSGGTLNTDYTVTNRIVTAAGLTDVRSITIHCRAR